MFLTGVVSSGNRKRIRFLVVVNTSVVTGASTETMCHFHKWRQSVMSIYSKSDYNGMHISFCTKLDIPCRAGSAKTLLNASAWLSSKWSPRASTSITSEIILSLGAHFHAWYDGLGAFWFVVYFFKNVSPKHVQKLIPNMPVLKLNLSFWSVFSGTFKIKFSKCQ